MKSTILLLAVTAAALSSCTTAYKTGQTPDDVYFSPARPEEEYVKTEKQEDRQYRYDDEYYDDRYLRMKVRDRSRWSDLDDWYYYGKRSNYYSYGWGHTWNPYIHWNYYYNPYCNNCCVVGNIKNTVAYSQPRRVNLNTYNSGFNPKLNTNPKNTSSPNNSYTGPRNTRNTTTSNTNSNAGNILRDIFSGNKNNSSSSNNSNSNSNSNSGSSSGSSTSSPAPVRRF